MDMKNYQTYNQESRSYIERVEISDGSAHMMGMATG